MKALPVGLRRSLIALAALLAVNVAGAYGLDALGLSESLLSGSIDRALLAAALGFLFYAARLALFFIAPGVALAMLILSLSGRRAATPRNGRRAPNGKAWRGDARARPRG